MAKIIDLQGKAVEVANGDDTYTNLHEVLVAGKTVRDITPEQLVYLLEHHKSLQDGLAVNNVLGPEWVRRLVQVEQPNENKTPEQS